MFMIEIEILLNDIWFDIGILYIDDSAQDCSKSIANALGLLQSCTKPLRWSGRNAR